MMEKTQDAKGLEATERPAKGMSRREMVRRVMLGASAGLALPGMAVAHPAAKHLVDAATLAQADTAASEDTKNWKPLFFDSHQNETFTVIAERIVPGSSRANVNQFIDLLLSVDNTEAQRNFVVSLGAFDSESLKRYSRPYKNLTEDQQNELLTLASTAKPEESQDEPDTEAISPKTISDHFKLLKGWVVAGYYSSEVGMKELGWTGQVMFPSFPGCQHPEKFHS